MKLSERLQQECDRITSRQYMGADRWVNSFAHSPETRLLLADAAALAKRYEDAPVGSLTAEGEHWVFYNGGEAGSVNRVLDKSIRLVEVLP